MTYMPTIGGDFTWHRNCVGQRRVARLFSSHASVHVNNTWAPNVMVPKLSTQAVDSLIRFVTSEEILFALKGILVLRLLPL